MATFGWCCKRADSQTGLPASGYIPSALFWAPKASEVSWAAAFMTYFGHLQEHLKFDGMEKLSGVLPDGTTRG